MQKIFLIIPGTERPHAVIGNYLFDDERFYVIENSGIKTRIPISKILYIEEAMVEVEHAKAAASSPQPGAQPSAPSQVTNDDKTDVNVFFTGHVEKVFKIKDVPLNIIKKDAWSTELAILVFQDEQIKPFMGTFTVSSMEPRGGNIYIGTMPLHNTAKPQPPISQQVAQSPPTSAQDLQKGVEAIGSILKMADGGKKFAKPEMAFVNTFTTSFNNDITPFDEPVSLTDKKSE